MKRVIYNNVIGTVLAEGRTCYFVRFPWGCRFLDKEQVTPTWERETKKALQQTVPACLNA